MNLKEFLIENWDKKKEFISKILNDNNIDNKLLDSIFNSDPVAVNSKGKKTPFVNQITKWLATNKIRLPEDENTVKEILLKYQDLYGQGKIKKQISEYDSPGDLRKDLTSPELERTSKYPAQVVFDNNDIKVYEVKNYDSEGKICFVDSGWCVKDEINFNEYKPPFFMIVDSKTEKRIALYHKQSSSLKDVHDNDIRDDETINRLKPFISNNLPEHIDADLLKFYPKDVVMKNPYWAYIYARDIIKGRWAEAEPYIMKSPKMSIIIDYAENIINGRWKEAEPYIMKDSYWAYEYARDIIKGRWPEAEPYIMKEPYWIYAYAKFVIKGRWPEAEPHIMKDPQSIYYYAADVIKGRWREAEPHIKQDEYHWELYRKEIMNNTIKEGFKDIFKKTALAGTALASLSGLPAQDHQKQVQPKQEIKHNSILNDAFLLNLIKNNEGFETTVYKDTKGNNTIGYGFNLDAPFAKQIIPEKVLNKIVKEKTPINKSHAEYLLKKSLELTYAQAIKEFPNLTSLPIEAQRVIMDLTYNMGSLTKFPKFKQAINNNKWNDAINELVYADGQTKNKFSQWWKDVTNNSPNLQHITNKNPNNRAVILINLLKSLENKKS